MRTKNKKWTVPILAIVPVLALAAFLAAGLLTPNNAEALAEGACGFTTANATNFTPATDDDDINDGVQCQVLEDSVTVTIENMDEDTKANVVVLVSGGNDYPNLQALDAAANANPEEIGKKGVSEMPFSVDEQERVGRKDVPGMATFTVTSSMAKDGEVFIALYEVSTGTDPLAELDADPPTWPDDTITSELTIVFLGAPSLTQPDAEADDDNNVGTPDDEDDDPNDVTDPSSTFAVDLMGVASTGITMADEAMYTISDVDDSQATIVATIKDGNGLLLKDGDDDIDSGVVFSYEYAMGSDLKSRRSLTGTEDVDVESDGTASFVLDEWKSGVKPVSVTVSAMYSGPTGSLDLGEITLSRSGTAETVMAATFSMDCLVDNNDDTDDPTGYTDDTFVKPADDNECEMDSRFGSKQVIVVKAHLEDALGSVVAGTLSVALDDDMDDPIDPDDNPTSLTAENTPGESSVWVYEIDKDAMLGDHMITVSFDDEDVADVVLTVAVAGPPMSYMISGPDNIDLGGRGMFTVTAVDANDGVPHFTMDNDMTDADESNNTVDVVVPDIAESLVRGRMLDNGVLTLDADTGMATFTIYAPSNAPDGSTARIFVSAGDVEITHTVTFGEAGAMPPTDGTTDPMDDRFTAMYTVMADSPSSGMVEVSWVTTQPISLVMLMDDQGMVAAWDVALLAIGNSAQFSEIPAGEYQVVVFSLTAGDFSSGGLAFGSVTVE